MQKRTSRTISSSRPRSSVELDIHSSYYSDFFLLRTPISSNGCPAVIKTVNGEPVLRISGITVKLSAIFQDAVAPVATKHGVYSVDNFYYEQATLFSLKFTSKSSLKQFLTEKEAVQNELSSAIGSLFKQEATCSKQPQSHFMGKFQVAVDVKVCLVSPAVGRSLVVNQINLANHSFMVETWKRSKLFDFTNAMFTKSPTASKLSGDQILKSMSLERTSKFSSSTTSTDSRHLDTLSKISDSKSATTTPTNKRDRIVKSITLESTPEVSSTTSANSRNLDTMNKTSDSTATTTPNNKRIETAELADLQVELKGVIAWFDLGIQLKIPTHDLLAIREDHRTVEKCRLNMLIRWEQLEKPTWTKLFLALVNIGMKGLAESLAEKYGLLQRFHATITPAKESQCHSTLMESEKKLLVKTRELNQAKKLQTATNQKLEKEVSVEVPLFQKKLTKLTSEIQFLRVKLKHRTEELEILERNNEDEGQFPESGALLMRKNEQIRFLQGELSEKEMELEVVKKQLKNKQQELAGMMEMLSTKADQVFKLQSEVERLRQSFDEQQEEMNRIMIEQSAASLSHEKYLKEIEIQRDIAVKEVSKKKGEIQSYSVELTDKGEQIKRLSKKIAEQEREMSKLQKKADSDHRTSKPLSAEQMREDVKKEQQLLTLITTMIQLNFEKRKATEEQNQSVLALEKMQRLLEKIEKEIKIADEASQRVDMENQSPFRKLVQSASQTRKLFPLADVSDSKVAKTKDAKDDDSLPQHIESQLANPQHLRNGKKTPLSEPKLPLRLKWRRGKDVPFVMRGGPSAILMKGDVYFGGASASSVKDEQTVCVYKPRSDSWSRLSLYKYKWFGLTVINENQLVAIGGQDVITEKETNKLAIWDDRQHNWVFSLPAMNTACHSPAVATYNQWLLIAGGICKQIRLSRVELMNVSSHQWYTVASLPVAWSGMSSALIGNTWYLIGGFTDKRDKSVISACVDHIISEAISQPLSPGPKSPTVSKWNSLPDTPLKYSTALAFEGALLTIGGWKSSTIYLYQPSTSKWVKSGDIPNARDMSACTVLPNGHIMIAGGSGRGGQVDIAQVII